jgi:photosystem II stability/assembly factor-like uncharacterized protein
VKYQPNARQLVILISSLLLLSPFLACKKEYFAFGKFSPITLPIADHISDLVFSDTLHGLACGGQIWGKGYILETSDGGQNWQKIHETNSYLEAIDLDSDAQYAVACGQGGKVCTRATAPSNWQESPNLHPDHWYRGVAITQNSTHALLVSGSGFRFGKVTETDRDSHIYQCPNELSDIERVNDSTFVAVGYGYVIRTTNSGADWTRLPLQNAFFTCIDFLDEQHGFIATESGTVYRSIDSGATWQKQYELEKKPLITDIAWATTQIAYACGRNGTIFKTHDSGTHWIQARDLPEHAWLTIQPIGKNVLVAGEAGKMLLLTYP